MKRLLFAALIIHCAIHAQSTGPFAQPGRIGNFPGVPTGLCNSGRDIGIDAGLPSLYVCGALGWILPPSGIDCKDATGSTTAYTCPSPSPVPMNYATGLLLILVPQTTNTTTGPTVNVAGLGSKNLKSAAGALLSVGALVGGNPYLFEYDGTQFVQTGGGTGGATGTVTSVTIAGTTRQITVSGTCTITTTGTCTLSLPSNLLFPGTPTFTASTTGGASFNLPSGSAPTSPNSGDFWNLSGVLQFYDGSGTRSLIANNTSAGGDLSGTYPNPTLATVNSGPGSCGDSTHVCQVTTNGKGLVTSQSAVSISAGGSGGVYCAPSSASGTTYTCAPTLSSYTSGMQVIFVPDVTATGGATTININSLGAKSIYLRDGATNPGPMDLVHTTSGQGYVLGYNGTAFIVLGNGSCITGSIARTSFNNTGTTQSFTVLSGMPTTWQFTGAQMVEVAQSTLSTITSLTMCMGSTTSTCDLMPAFALGSASAPQNGWNDIPAVPIYYTGTWTAYVNITAVGGNVSTTNVTAGGPYNWRICGQNIQ